MKRTCSHPGCERPGRNVGLCGLHYRRMREGYDMDAPSRYVKLTPELIESVRAAMPGRTREQVAALLGVSRSVVERAKKAGGIKSDGRKRPLPEDLIEAVRDYAQYYNDTKIAEMLGISQNTVWKIRDQNEIPPFKKGRAPLPNDVQIPLWVPEKLHDGFRREVRNHGEFAAAAWAREAKKKGASFVQHR